MIRKGDCCVGLGACCTLRYHFVSPFAAASRSEASIRFFSSGVWIIGEPGVEPGLELYVPLDMRCLLDEGCSGVPGLGDSDAPERCMNYVDHLSATFVLFSRETNERLTFMFARREDMVFAPAPALLGVDMARVLLQLCSSAAISFSGSVRVAERCLVNLLRE